MELASILLNTKIKVLCTESKNQKSVKGQIKPKADWRAVDSPKKQTNEFVLFAFLLFTANKTNSFVCFLGETTSRPNRFWLYLTFNVHQI